MTGSILAFPPMRRTSADGVRRIELRPRVAWGSEDRLAESLDRSVPEEQPTLPGHAVEPIIAFGPFRVCARRRLLLEGETPLRLGSRAFDILIALVERPGELLTKQDLYERVWPGVTVEEGNLKVHIAALRRTLRDGQDGARYICTVPGRGYSFVAPVELSDFSKPEAPMPKGPKPAAVAEGPRRLRSAPMPMPQPVAVGGGDLIDMLADQPQQENPVTVVGIGDMARRIVLAAALMANGQDRVRIVDMAQLDDTHRVPTAVAAAIGLETGQTDPLADVAAFLQDRHMLLVLDNCRHVMGQTTAFAAGVLGCAPSAQILAISR